MSEVPMGCVLACPTCGREVEQHCYHDGAVRSQLMTAYDAERLRWESGEYDRHMFTCDICRKEQEIAVGTRMGPGWQCALCAAATQGVR